MDSKVLAILDSLDVLKKLPTEVLREIVKYVVFPMVQGKRFKTVDIPPTTRSAKPSSIDVHGDSLCVVNGLSHEIFMFDLELNTWTSIQANLLFPYGCCFDTERNEMIVADKENYRILVFNQNLTLRYVIDEKYFHGRRIHPVQVCIDPGRRRLYILEIFSGDIFMYHLDQRISLGKLKIQEKLLRPVSICFDPLRDWLWVTDSGKHRIVAIDAVSGGAFQRVLGGDVLFQPYDLVLSWSGEEVLVVDEGAVKVFSISSGDILFKFGENHFSCPVGIARDDQRGLVYVIDHGNAAVFFFY